MLKDIDCTATQIKTNMEKLRDDGHAYYGGNVEKAVNRIIYEVPWDGNKEPIVEELIDSIMQDLTFLCRLVGPENFEHLCTLILTDSNSPKKLYGKSPDKMYIDEGWYKKYAFWAEEIKKEKDNNDI